MQQVLSRKLNIPSPAVKTMVRVANEAFDKFHGRFLQRKGVIKRLVAQILIDNPDFDKKILTKFIRVRTYVRIMPMERLFISLKF